MTEPICKLTVDQYHEMARTGILREDDPIELLDGWLVSRTAKTPPHCAATALVRKVLEHALPRGLHIQSQGPVTLAASEPEPDVAIVRGEPRDYSERHPGARDVALVVEVADASLERDRTLKQRIYAEAGIPVYWIVNLLDRRLEVYADPSGPSEAPGYRTHQDDSSQDRVPLLLGGREVARIPVAELLP